jgi:heme exporter protein A
MMTSTIDQNSTSTMMLQISAAQVYRGTSAILDDINLSLAPGHSMMVTGKNGSGKTTLLRIVAGLLPKTSGVILLNNRSIEDAPLAYKAGLIYLGHQDGLSRGLTCGENIMFWAQSRGMIAAQPQLKKAFQALGVDPLIATETRHLSEGERRRVGLVRLAYSHMQSSDEPPPLWLLDEPTAALDTAAIDLLTDLINAHTARGGSAIVTSHNKIDLERIDHLDLDAKEIKAGQG